MGAIETKLRELGIELPTKVPAGKGLVPVVRHGDLLFVSGHGPASNDGTLLYRGRVGAEVSSEDAYQAARAAGIQLLRSIRDYLGDLDRVDHIVKALGFVNSADDFHEQPAVMHGFSDLMIEVFGAERGRHARSAIGTSNLPDNQPVEIELIVAVRD
ncbi:RidA family protein [Microlunatus sp. Gsoil 973]|uniref:RidA family protein n=1 Tax=Microlunatus sp. Gsoil 973 TaxID=2672569 RepID=UPI0012B4436D|nr:RidA family protein [Microlunatus sp. Gsoil 973]QGN34388.1 RidA family protein [Microlunatus sp. Gsoil 973]